MGANLSSLKAVRTSSELNSFLSEDTIEDGAIQNLLQFHIKPPKTIEECKSLVEICTELKNEIPKDSSKNLAALVEVTANPDISETLDDESLKIIHNGLFFIKWYCLTHSDDSEKLIDIKVEIEAMIIPFLIKIITTLAITDKTYHIVLEAADILAILVEISPKIDLFENEKNLIIALLKNFTSQIPAPVFPFGQPSGFGHAIASGMWSVMTVGMGSMNETVDLDYKPLSHSSIALLLKLVDSNTLCNSALCNMTDTKETNFSDLHYLLLAGDEFIPFLKKMLRSNMTYRKFVIMATDLSLVIGPVLKDIYNSGDDDYTKLGDKFELLQILSKDELFNQAIHSCSKSGSNVWYKEKLLKNIKLGGMIVIVLLRSILQNKYDTIFQKTCMNILVQMSVHFSLLDLYPSERLVGCLEFLLKKHSRLVLSSEYLDASNVEDLVKKLLVIINNALVNQTQNNPNLVYSLLYKRELLSSYTNQNDEFIQHFQNVNNLLEHVSNKIDEHSDDPNGIMDTSILLGVIQAAISEYPKDSFEAYTNIEEVPATVVEVAKEEINLAVSKEVVSEDADVPLSTDLTNEESNIEISQNSEAVNEAAIADIVSEQETTPDTVPVENEATDELNLPKPTEGVTIEKETCENDNIDASHTSVAEVGEDKNVIAPTNEESGAATVNEVISQEKATEERIQGDAYIPDDDSVHDLPAENSEEKLEAKVIEKTPGAVEQVTDNIVEISQNMIIKEEETNPDTIEETTSLEDVSKTNENTKKEEVVESVEIYTSHKSVAEVGEDKNVIIPTNEESGPALVNEEISHEKANDIEVDNEVINSEERIQGDAYIPDDDSVQDLPAENSEEKLEAKVIEETPGAVEQVTDNIVEISQNMIIKEEETNQDTIEETTSLEDVSKTNDDTKIEEVVESVEIDTDKTDGISANNSGAANDIEEAPTENVEEETIPGQETKTEVTLENITLEEHKTNLTEVETTSLGDVSKKEVDCEIEETVESVEIDTDKTVEISANVNEKEEALTENIEEETAPGQEIIEMNEEPKTELSENSLAGEAIDDQQDSNSEMKEEIAQEPTASDPEELKDTNSAEAVANEESAEVVNNPESVLLGEETDQQVEKTQLIMNQTCEQDSAEVQEGITIEQISETDPIPAESTNLEVVKEHSQIEASSEEEHIVVNEVNKDVIVEIKDEIDSTETCEEETSPAMETSSNKIENEVIDCLNREEKVVIEESLTEEQVEVNVKVPEETSDSLASDIVNEEELVSNDKIADTSCEEVAEPLDAKSNSNTMLLETKTVEENSQSDEVVSEATASQTSDEASDDSTMVEFEAFNKETQSPVTFLIDSKMLEKLLIRSESRVIITNFEVIPSGPNRNQSGDSAIFSHDEDSEVKKATEKPDVYTEFADQQRKINFAQIHNEKEKPTPKTPPTRNVPVEAMSTNLYLAGSNIKFDLDEKLKICGTPVSPGANIIWKRAAMV